MSLVVINCGVNEESGHRACLIVPPTPLPGTFAYVLLLGSWRPVSRAAWPPGGIYEQRCKSTKLTNPSQTSAGEASGDMTGVECVDLVNYIWRFNWPCVSQLSQNGRHLDLVATWTWSVLKWRNYWWYLSFPRGTWHWGKLQMNDNSCEFNHCVLLVCKR